MPTPGSTTATWVPTGMWGRAKTSEPAPLADGVARDLVVDVDDVGVGRDAEHHAAADRRRGRPEVGEERDDGAHRRMVPRACAPAPGRAEAAPGGGSAPLRGCRSLGREEGHAVAIGNVLLSVRASTDLRRVVRSVRSGPWLAQEEQLIDLADRPARVRDRDPAHERGQRGRFVRRRGPGSSGGDTSPGSPLVPSRPGGAAEVAERGWVVAAEPGPAVEAAARRPADEPRRGDRPRPREPRCARPSMSHGPSDDRCVRPGRSGAVGACWSRSRTVAMTRRS